MINKFFEVKVKYEKTDQNGKEKIVTEPYLIDAVSFTDTESSIVKQLEPYISGEFMVVGEKISEFAELISNEDGDKWFKCRIIFIAINEETGKPKETGVWVLVQAFNIKEAYDNINDKFEETVFEYRIKQIGESPIIDVFVDLKSDDLTVEDETNSGWIDFETNKELFNQEAKKNCLCKFDDDTIIHYYEDHPMSEMTHFKLSKNKED